MAQSVCFITLEDETGLANAMARSALYARDRVKINLESALVITGRVRNEQGVTDVPAERNAALPDMTAGGSHDWH